MVSTLTVKSRNYIKLEEQGAGREQNETEVSLESYQKQAQIK